MKFDICGEINPLVFSALEGMNLFHLDGELNRDG